MMNFRFRTLLLYGFFFFMPAAYSYPGRIYYYLTALQGFEDFSVAQLVLLPSIALSVLLLAIKAYEKKFFPHYPLLYTNKPLLAVIFIWFLSALISFIANYQTTGVGTNFVAVYLTALLVYLAFSALTLNKKEYIGIFTALALGSLFPLVIGTLTYYQTWGIPIDANTLLYSHFDAANMENYFLQTFGNTGNTAAFLVLIVPALLVVLVNEKLPFKLKFLFIFVLALSVFNLLIIESRTAFLVILISICIISYLKSVKHFLLYTLLSLVALVAVLSIISPDFLATFVHRMVLAITFTNTETDISASEREAAMQAGWNIFINNFFAGVGPGAASDLNPFTAAHQFNVEQASQLGISGFIASLLLCFAVLAKFVIAIFRYKQFTPQRFAFIIGPACYLLYGVLANTTLNVGIVNTWIALTCALLALADAKLIPNNLTTENTYENSHHLRYAS